MHLLQLLTSLFNFVVTAEFITFIAAIFLLRKKRTGIWRLFIALFVVTILTETIGWYWNHFLHKPNGWIFNINLVITIVFLLWMLSTAEPVRKTARVIYAVIIFFVAAALVNLLFFQGFVYYNQYTETIGDILQVIVCCYFFYALITEETYRNLLAYEYFWLANGILFSSMISTFLYIFPVVLRDFQKHTGINAFGIVNNVLNILLYGSIIIAFICRNRNTKL